MNSPSADERAAWIERAEESLKAASQLLSAGHDDYAASRAYYAAFYAAYALLLGQEPTPSKHAGVISFIHARYVKTGKLSREQGRMLDRLFELRSIGDYGGASHVSPEDARKSLQMAEEFVNAIKALLRSADERKE